MKGKKNKRNLKNAENDIIALRDDEIKKILCDDFGIANFKIEYVPKLRKYFDNYSKILEKNIQNINDCYNQAESYLKQILNISLEIVKIESNNELLVKELESSTGVNEILSKKFNDKEKFNKLLINKLNLIIDERDKELQSESERKNKIVIETENFVKELQEKYEADFPEKQELLNENQRLRNQIEEYVKESINIKESIENKLKVNDPSNSGDSLSFTNDLKLRMEEVSTNTQKLLFVNMELKKQTEFYKLKYDEMSSNINIYTDKYQEFLNNIEKKKEEIILLSKENYEIGLLIKDNDKIYNDLIKEKEKKKNQLNAMKSLNKKLRDQLNT